MTDGRPMDALVRRAIDGDRAAVRDLVRAIENDVLGLALRMLWNRADAEDATQEILVRVVTRLSRFDFESDFRTWVYRVATNALLDVKKSAVERMRLRFETLGDDLEQGLSDAGPADAERSLLVEEVKIGCTLAMLQCLDRPHRIAYVLGAILELPADDAAEALGIEPAALRKRLERARSRLESFTRARCGLVSEAASCACHRRVPEAIRLGRMRPDALELASAPTSFAEARAALAGLEAARRSLELHRRTHPRGSDVDFAARIVEALDGQASTQNLR